MRRASPRPQNPFSSFAAHEIRTEFRGVRRTYDIRQRQRQRQRQPHDNDHAF